MNNRIIVCGIIRRDKEILLGKKEKGKPPYPNVWHILGGGVKDQKLAEELLSLKKFNDPYFHDELKREIKEEANIIIKNIINLCPKYRFYPREDVTKNKDSILTHYIFLEYFCEYDSGIPKPGDDISELKWIKISDLKSISLTPPSKTMYKEIGWLV